MDKNNTNNTTAKNTWAFGLIAVLFLHAFDYLSYSGVTSLMPILRNTLKMTYTQVGIFNSISSIAMIISALVAGTAVHKFGEKKVLIASFLLSTAGLLGISYASTFNTALMFRFWQQAFYRATMISTMTAANLAVPASFRGRALGLTGVATGIGGIIGSPLGVAISELVGLGNSLRIYCLFHIIGIIIFWSAYKRYTSPEISQPTHDTTAMSCKPSQSPYKNKIVMGLTAISFLLAAPIHYYFSIITVDLFHKSNMAGAVIASIGNAGAIIFNLGAGISADKFTHLKTVFIISALCTVNCLAMAIACAIKNYELFCINSVLWTFSMTARYNILYAVVGDAMNGKHIGTINGLLAFAYAVGELVVNYGSSFIINKAGGFFMFFALVAVLVGTASFIALRINKRLSNISSLSASEKAAQSQGG